MEPEGTLNPEKVNNIREFSISFGMSTNMLNGFCFVFREPNLLFLDAETYSRKKVTLERL